VEQPQLDSQYGATQSADTFVCPEAESHGRAFRYCPVKGCGWMEPKPTPELRHSATVAIMQFFDTAHLPEDLAAASQPCRDLAVQMLNVLPDGPELTTGLRKLLEAKDCFVRAALGARKEN
jgi:hypothetical protein